MLVSGSVLGNYTCLVQGIRRDSLSRHGGKFTNGGSGEQRFPNLQIDQSR